MTTKGETSKAQDCFVCGKPLSVPRHVNLKYCDACRKEFMAPYWKRRAATCHPDKPNAGGGLCGTCYSRKRSAEGPEQAHKYVRAEYLLREYGLLEEAYLQLLKESRGVCAICDQLMVRPQVDHDHATGRVRGLLCTPCNAALGLFKDNPALLQRASLYLTNSRSEESNA